MFWFQSWKRSYTGVFTPSLSAPSKHTPGENGERHHSQTAGWHERRCASWKPHNKAPVQWGFCEDAPEKVKKKNPPTRKLALCQKPFCVLNAIERKKSSALHYFSCKYTTPSKSSIKKKKGFNKMSFKRVFHFFLGFGRNEKWDIFFCTCQIIHVTLVVLKLGVCKILIFTMEV